MTLRMPGKSYRGPLPRLTERESAMRDALRCDVEKLASEIGERNLYKYDELNAAADFLHASFASAGHDVRRQTYEADGLTYQNLEVELFGTDRPDEIIVAGGHYDSVPGSPGANDNATGVAAVLALARAFADRRASRTLRLVAFVNEEPPHFGTPDMGSAVYAARCREREENVVGMISLETIGCYSEAKGSQDYPFPLSLIYPSTADFIAFVGNVASRDWVRQVVGSFRTHAKFPSEGAAIPEGIAGVAASDQWAFWEQGYPALMVTDTAPYRYPHYHTAEDTPEKIDYDRLARVVAGIEKALADIAGISSGQ